MSETKDEEPIVEEIVEEPTEEASESCCGGNEDCSGAEETDPTAELLKQIEGLQANVEAQKAAH